MKKIICLIALLSFFTSLAAKKKTRRKIFRAPLLSHKDVESFYLKSENGSLSLDLNYGFILPTRAIKSFYVKPCEAENKNAERLSCLEFQLKKLPKNSPEYFEAFLQKEELKALSYSMLILDLELAHKSKVVSFFDLDKEAFFPPETWQIKFKVLFTISYRPFLLDRLKEKFNALDSLNLSNYKEEVYWLYRKTLELQIKLDKFTKENRDILVSLKEQKNKPLRNSKRSLLLMTKALKLYRDFIKERTRLLAYRESLPESLHKEFEVLPNELVPNVAFSIQKELLPKAD